MSRYAIQASNTVVQNALDTIARQEQQYKGPIEENHVMSLTMAEVLAVDGHLEKLLLSLTEPTATTTTDDDDDDEENEGGEGGGGIFTREFVESFLDEQRGRLKRIAMGNVENGRNVERFVGAIRTLRDNVSKQNDAEDQGNNNEDQDRKVVEVDYGKVIQETMEKMDEAAAAAASSSSSSTNMDDEEKVQEVCERMGQPVGNAATGMNEDGIEVVGGNGPGTSAQSLKCPVTGLVFVDPVKNKVCGHVYSLEGIKSHIARKKNRQGAVSCPIPGCANMVTMDQLVRDIDMEYRVKRAHRNKQHQEEIMASQATALDDTDDEMENTM